MCANFFVQIAVKIAQLLKDPLNWVEIAFWSAHLTVGAYFMGHAMVIFFQRRFAIKSESNLDSSEETPYMLMRGEGNKMFRWKWANKYGQSGSVKWQDFCIKPIFKRTYIKFYCNLSKICKSLPSHTYRVVHIDPL